MPRFVSLFVVTLLLMITADRLPAPISEIPGSPTPTPAVAQFAGTWTGRITIDKFADTDVTLVISTDGTSVAQTSQAGVWTRPLTYDGKLLSWRTGPTNRVSWTLQLNPDEQSALVTRTWSGIQTRGIFKRVQ